MGNIPSKIKMDLFSKWEEIMRENHMDDRGYIACETCGAKVMYEEMKLGVYYKKQFPLWFNKENNYFCCEGCEPDRRKTLYLRRKYSKVGKIEYNLEDLIIFDEKLKTIIRNVAWQNMKERE